MLLANQTVAETIYKAYPQQALLRRHPPPNPRKLLEFRKVLDLLSFLVIYDQFCDERGIHIDTNDSASFHTSLQSLSETYPDISFISEIIQEYHKSLLSLVNCSLATKPMQTALYFNTGDLPIEEYRHYALNVCCQFPVLSDAQVPYYTHFTSPIRRYADLQVHRLLHAHLSGDMTEVASATNITAVRWLVLCFRFMFRLPSTATIESRRQRKHKMHPLSCNLIVIFLRFYLPPSYLALYLKSHEVEFDAIVTELGRRSSCCFCFLFPGQSFLRVFLPMIGINTRVFLDDCMWRFHVCPYLSLLGEKIIEDGHGKKIEKLWFKPAPEGWKNVLAVPPLHHSHTKKGSQGPDMIVKEWSHIKIYLRMAKVNLIEIIFCQLNVPGSTD